MLQGLSVRRQLSATIAQCKTRPLVHIWSPCTRVGLWEKLWLARLARSRGARVVLSLRNALDYWYCKWTTVERAMVRRELKQVHLIVSQSTKLARFLRTEIISGASATRVAIVPNGIPEREWRARSSVVGRWPSSGCRLLFLGSIKHVKGLDVLVRALQTLHTKGMRDDEGSKVRLEIVGDEVDKAYAARIKREIRRSQLEDVVTFTGPVLGDEKWAAYQRSSVVVLPSRAEGFANVILEGMTAGRPIIATDVGASAEVVVDGDTGLIVPPENVAALAGAIGALRRRPWVAKRMGLAARRRVGKNFTMERVLPHLCQEYASLKDPSSRADGPPSRDQAPGGTSLI